MEKESYSLLEITLKNGLKGEGMDNKLIKILDRRVSLEQKLTKLKENPRTESQFRSDIDADESLSTKEKAVYLTNINKYMKQGIVVKDVMPTFEEFSKNAEANGKYPIKASVFKQMTSDQQRQFTKKTPAIYPDINPKSKIQHYTYKDTNGVREYTGEGVGVVHTETQNQDLIINASRSYQSAQNEIGKILKDLEVRGSLFKDYLK